MLLFSTLDYLQARVTLTLALSLTLALTLNLTQSLDHLQAAPEAVYGLVCSR